MKSRIRTRDLLIKCLLASGPIAFVIFAAALADGSLLHQHALREFIKPARVAAPNDFSVCEFESAGKRGLSVVSQEPMQHGMVPVGLMEERDVLLGYVVVNRNDVFKPDCARAMRSQLARLSTRAISHPFDS